MLAASLGIPYPTPTLSFVLPVIFPIQDVLELVLETVRKIRSERGGAPLTEPWWHTPWLHCSRISARNLCSGAGSGLTKRKSVPRPSGAVILGSRVVGGSSSTRSPFPPVPTPRAALGDVAQPVRSSLTPARSTPCPCSCRCSPYRARHARVATTAAWSPAAVTTRRPHRDPLPRPHALYISALNPVYLPIRGACAL